MSDRPARTRGGYPVNTPSSAPKAAEPEVTTEDAPAEDAAAPEVDPEPAPATSPGTPAEPVSQAPQARLVALPPDPVPPADPAREQAILHLQAHLADVKTIVMAFPHKVEGKLGEVISYLRENL